MADFPIIFSAPMVQALLAGRKTMTRRLAWRTKINPGGPILDAAGGQVDVVEPHEVRVGPSPWQKAKPGDRLWVRESVYIKSEAGNCYFSADKAGVGDSAYFHLVENVKSWRDRTIPATHMPRPVSRLTLIVEAVKVERLQEISETDAVAEGARRFDGIPLASYDRHYPLIAPRWSMEAPRDTGECLGAARYAFGNFINRLHGGPNWNLKPSSLWAENPEVVALTFRCIHQNIDQVPQ